VKSLLLFEILLHLTSRVHLASFLAAHTNMTCIVSQICCNNIQSMCFTVLLCASLSHVPSYFIASSCVVVICHFIHCPNISFRGYPISKYKSQMNLSLKPSLFCIYHFFLFSEIRISPYCILWVSTVS